MSDQPPDPPGPGAKGPSDHGSVAEEIAALAQALRARAPRRDHGSPADEDDIGADAHNRQDHHIDTCGFCPVCRSIAALHSVSPAAVSALADLAQQAEVALRVLATDLQRQQGQQGQHGQPEGARREDIPVEDIPVEDIPVEDN